MVSHSSIREVTDVVCGARPKTLMSELASINRSMYSVFTSIQMVSTSPPAQLMVRPAPFVFTYRLTIIITVSLTVRFGIPTILVTSPLTVPVVIIPALNAATRSSISSSLTRNTLPLSLPGTFMDRTRPITSLRNLGPNSPTTCNLPSCSR